MRKPTEDRLDLVFVRKQKRSCLGTVSSYLSTYITPDWDSELLTQLWDSKKVRSDSLSLFFIFGHGQEEIRINALALLVGFLIKNTEYLIVTVSIQYPLDAVVWIDKALLASSCFFSVETS